MNPSLANFILSKTPKSILHPAPTMNTAIPLNTGATIPALGLGTWQSAPGEVKKAVVHAIEAGYRHIDCAFCYQNEDEVGEALQDVISRGIVKREDLFITSKLWCTFHTRVEEGLQKSLDLLKTPYVDLYLMHWPVPMNPKGNHPLFPKLEDGSRDIDHSTTHVQTWKNLEKLIQTHPERVKAIGVANYSVKYLEKLLAQATIVPAANQIENHPLLPQQEVVDFCKAKGIHITAYSPLGSTGSPLFKDEAVNEVAKKHNVGPGTVLLSYHLARNSSVLAKSVTPARIDENRKLIVLDAEDMQKLESIHKNGITRFVYPPFGVNCGFPDKPDGIDLSG
ncbi:Aldo/keto reductase [Lentithecium fluviatile CBS 122367]|uniref:Aldo/keto reductase n=1 Tax=Lentithecium fluviatile CBS 122367 TaxID=1168545 RepID=A0A6G1JHI6_9PLEO|nr:Aldo/keto reductase [Lentithecium fluviatile CBS 122367]